MVKSTPGPWLVQATDTEGPDFGVAIVGDNLGGLVGAALPWPTEIDSGDMSRVEANARLIAAAPDLLNACKAMQQRIIEAMDLERISPAAALEEMSAIVDAAIAKAQP